MKKYVTLFLFLFLNSYLFAQTDVPDAGSANPLGGGAWLRFVTGGNATSILENWGLNLSGSTNQPIKIRNASLLVGYTSAATNFGQGNLLVSGNVGIGTSTPQTTLDVNGSGRFNSFVNIFGASVTNTTSQSNINAYQNNGIHINGNRADVGQDAITYSSGGGGGAAVVLGRGVSYDTFLAFYTNKYGNMVTGAMMEAMRINESQNVGIGTTQPDQKLTVNGTIHSQAVKVDLSIPGPDYVFKKTYNLPQLSRVKSYIEKNQHLSEIPSAVQMAKNGVDLGEMNIKLLKKVEELTLYLIEKDKKDKQQTNEIKVLKKQMVTLLKNPRRRS